MAYLPPKTVVIVRLKPLPMGSRSINRSTERNCTDEHLYRPLRHGRPHYGAINVEAEDDSQALIVARAKWADYRAGKETLALDDAAWDNGVLARIVHIERDDGTEFGAEVNRDVPLDTFRLCSVAGHDDSLRRLAIGALIREARGIFLDIGRRMDVAQDDLGDDQILAAIGATLGLDDRLGEAMALLRAVGVLNRTSGACIEGGA